MGMTGASDPIVVWGAGAIGGAIGAYFVRAGQDVLFVDQDASHVEVMNREGLTIEGLNAGSGARHVQPYSALR